MAGAPDNASHVFVMGFWPDIVVMDPIAGVLVGGLIEGWMKLVSWLEVEWVDFGEVEFIDFSELSWMSLLKSNELDLNELILLIGCFIKVG